MGAINLTNSIFIAFVKKKKSENKQFGFVISMGQIVDSVLSFTQYAL